MQGEGRVRSQFMQAVHARGVPEITYSEPPPWAASGGCCQNGGHSRVFYSPCMAERSVFLIQQNFLHEQSVTSTVFSSIYSFSLLY